MGYPGTYNPDNHLGAVMHEQHGHRLPRDFDLGDGQPVTESDFGPGGDFDPFADLDPLGVNRVIVGPRRIEHLPVSDPAADFDPDAVERAADARGVLDPGEHFRAILDERAAERAESQRAFVRRLQRSALLQRLAARRAGGDRSGPRAAVAGRRAAVDAATSALIGRHMSPRRDPLPWWA